VLRSDFWRQVLGLAPRGLLRGSDAFLTFLKRLSVNRVTDAQARLEDRGTVMTSPYLNRRLLSFAVALPGMLENIEAELADTKLEAAEELRLQERAKLVRGLLTPNQQAR
jgi:hypothetical protein